VLNTVKLRELEAASESFDRALQLAKLQDDRAAENAIRRAIDDISSTLAKRPRHTSQNTHGALSRVVR